jgi:transposase
MVGGKTARERLSEVVGIGELLAAAAAAAASRLGFEHPKRTSSSICLTFGMEEMSERRLLEE